VRSISFMAQAQPTMTAVKKLPVMAAMQTLLGGVRHTTAGHARGLKTKKAVAKRFILTGKGKLKRGHAFRRHLTSHKSPARKRRLACKEVMTGTWAKKMKKLILFGK
jgi:large subunit ribosomal protein L35